MDILDWSVPYLKYFEEMTRIPHGSCNEKQYSDYLVDWAHAHHLRYIQDKLGNVIIYKHASAGYKDHAPVILQAHMDMVCAKTPDSAHDFTKDPLDLYIEDGFLKARNTTLGGDDGVGVAYMLAILASDELAHPPLECVFTVQEETGCAGAAALKKEYFQARRMIGLDDVGGGTSYVTTAGSQLVQFSHPITWEAASAPAYELKIGGLLSGHSGVDIDKERGNAIKLAARTLFALQKKEDVRIAALDFGSADNVIPAYGSAVFTTDLPVGELMDEVEKCRATFLRELEFSDAGLTMELAPSQAEKVASSQDSQDMIQFFRYLPNGMQHKSMRFENLPTASCNIGTLRIQGDMMLANECHRGALLSYIHDMEEDQEMLCSCFHMGRKVTGFVAPFDYIENSPIRAALAKAFHEVTGRDLQPVCVHGGIEAGYFKELYPEMDIVTIGPLVLDEHMVTERLDLKSFHEIWQVVTRLLSAL